MFKPKVDELKSELIDYCDFTEEDVDAMSRYELFDEWLKYNGIIGYTDDIIKMLSCASGVNLVSKLGNE
jgi:hypothetical protein